MKFHWFRVLPSNKCIWNMLFLSALDRGGHGRDAFDLLAAPPASRKRLCSFKRTCAALLYMFNVRKNEAGAGPNMRNVLSVGVTAAAPSCPQPVNVFFSSQHVYVPWRRWDSYHLWDADVPPQSKHRSGYFLAWCYLCFSMYYTC